MFHERLKRLCAQRGLLGNNVKKSACFLWGTDLAWRMPFPRPQGVVLFPGSSPAVDQELSAILNELWKLDVNCEARKRLHHQSAGFINLLDNYEMSTGVAEKVTSEELEENNIFLNAILQTQVMKHAHGYLVSKGKASSDIAQFKKQLFDVWFKLYHEAEVEVQPPPQRENLCGFEHVFVGETKHGKQIMGLHNWVQFYLQEKLNCIDYKGYTASHKDRPDVNDRVISLQFSWKGLLKPLGSSFIGVSPEFEVALYTIIFLNRNDQVSNTVVKVDKYLLEVMVCRQGHAIGTSYPKLLDKTLGACSFSTDQSKKI